MGVVAVNIIGDPMGAALGAPGRSMGGVVADLALDMNVDAVTASKIRDVLVQKQAAVDREDYDECKRLKVEEATLSLHPDRRAPCHDTETHRRRRCASTNCAVRHLRPPCLRGKALAGLPPMRREVADRQEQASDQLRDSGLSALRSCAVLLFFFKCSTRKYLARCGLVGVPRRW